MMKPIVNPPRLIRDDLAFMIHQSTFCFTLFSVFLLSSCSTVPKTSVDQISLQEAEAFAKNYCSRYSSSSTLDHELTGEILVRSNTREFKGQYPASIHFDPNRSYSLEVTNLIGGTIALIKGDPKGMEVKVSGKPQYDRKGVREYMGLSSMIFAELIHGDLPCPAERRISVDKNQIVLKSPPLEWRFERAERESGLVPVRLTILEKSQIKVEMVIEKWNQDDSYAEKVKVQTADGYLKWSWRSRFLKK